MNKEEDDSVGDVALNSATLTYAFFGAILMFIAGYFAGRYFGGV